jgi:hypothetical protein
MLASLALMSVLQSAVALTNADLRLVATAPSRVLVGEFVTVRTTWTIRRRIEAPCDPTEQGLVEIDRGRGFEPHVEPLQGWQCVFRAPEPMAAGRRIHTEHLVGLESREAPPDLSGLDEINASLAFVFDRPGRYRLRVRYDEATSNVIAVDVAAPTGADAAVLDILRARPIVLSKLGQMDPGVFEEAEALVRRYGRHRYLEPFLLRPR